MTQPPDAPPATDPLTDLMRRVTHLEDELRAAKQTRAA